VFEETVEIGGKEWLKRVCEELEKLGVSFEAEENVRIHVDDIVVQIAEGGDKAFSVSISIQLPPSEVEDLEKYVDSFRKALTIASRMRSGELAYELDTSLPDYPFLYIVRKYDDVETLVKELVEALKSVG